jgi:hypothetical protein
MRKHKQGTYQDFKKFMLDLVKGKRQVDPNEPKIWMGGIIGSMFPGSSPPPPGFLTG